jgi:hypothetical protein
MRDCRQCVLLVRSLETAWSRIRTPTAKRKSYSTGSEVIPTRSSQQTRRESQLGGVVYRENRRRSLPASARNPKGAEQDGYTGQQVNWVRPAADTSACSRCIPAMARQR